MFLEYGEIIFNQEGIKKEVLDVVRKLKGCIRAEYEHLTRLTNFDSGLIIGFQKAE